MSLDMNGYKGRLLMQRVSGTATYGRSGPDNANTTPTFRRMSMPLTKDDSYAYRRVTNSKASSAPRGEGKAEFFRRLSLGIMSNSPAHFMLDESASFLKHYNEEKKRMSSLGRESKNVASSFSNLRKTSGKSAASVPTTEETDQAMLRKTSYFRFGPRLSNKRLSAWKLKEKNLQRFLKNTSVPERDLTIHKWIPQDVYSDSDHSSDEESMKHKCISPEASNDTKSAAPDVSLVQMRLHQRRHSAPPNHRSSPPVQQRKLSCAIPDVNDKKSAAKIIREITRSYIEEAVKPIELSTRTRSVSAEPDAESHNFAATSCSRHLAVESSLSGMSEELKAQSEHYRKYERKHLIRAQSATAGSRRSHQEPEPRRPVTARPTSCLRNKSRKLKKQNIPELRIHFASMERISEDPGSSNSPAGYCNGDKEPSGAPYSSRPVSARKVESTSASIDQPTERDNPQDNGDTSPQPSLPVRRRSSFHTIVRSAIEKETLDRDANLQLINGDFNSLPQWKRELLRDAPQLFTGDSSSKVNMTMSQSARKRELNRLVQENETDRRQLIRKEHDRREQSKWSLVMSVLALKKLGDEDDDSSERKAVSAASEQRRLSSAKLHPQNRTVLST